MSKTSPESPRHKIDQGTLLAIQRGRALPLPEFIDDPEVVSAFLNHMSRLSDTEIINFLEAFISSGHEESVEKIIKNRSSIEKELNRAARKAAVGGMLITANAIGLMLSSRSSGMELGYYLGGAMILAMLVLSQGAVITQKINDNAMKQVQRIDNLLYAVKTRHGFRDDK